MNNLCLVNGQDRFVENRTKTVKRLSVVYSVPLGAIKTKWLLYFNCTTLHLHL